jgi:hypothetical protein
LINIRALLKKINIYELVEIINKSYIICMFPHGERAGPHTSDMGYGN